MLPKPLPAFVVIPVEELLSQHLQAEMIDATRQVPKWEHMTGSQVGAHDRFQSQSIQVGAATSGITFIIYVVSNMKASEPAPGDAAT